MRKFKAGDKVKVVSAEYNRYWYASKIGSIYTLKSFDGYAGWVTIEAHRYHTLAECDLELVQDEKEATSAWLKANKWFIRTGSPEKSKLVQEWLFEHGMETGWLVDYYKGTYLTNTSVTGDLRQCVMHGSSDETNAQEITLEFETVVKSVKLPEVAPKKTKQELRIIELEATIAQASAQIKQLKEEI